MMFFLAGIEGFPFYIFLTLPMPEGRGFLVRQPLRRLRRIGVLHDFPKREFPCAPRYTLFQFMPLWIYLPKPCTGCSLQHSHLCRDAFHTSGNPIREHSNPLSVGSKICINSFWISILSPSCRTSMSPQRSSRIAEICPIVSNS